MLKTCKHSNCAVCTQISEREVFKSILKTTNPDTFICEHAMYKITNSNGGEFILPSLEYLLKGRNGYFVRDMYTSLVIPLDTKNFEVLCSKEGECEQEPYVSEYVLKHKKSS